MDIEELSKKCDEARDRGLRMECAKIVETAIKTQDGPVNISTLIQATERLMHYIKTGEHTVNNQ